MEIYYNKHLPIETKNPDLILAVYDNIYCGILNNLVCELCQNMKSILLQHLFFQNDQYISLVSEDHNNSLRRENGYEEKRKKF